jgi:hypothetical protein
MAITPLFFNLPNTHGPYPERILRSIAVLTFQSGHLCQPAAMPRGASESRGELLLQIKAAVVGGNPDAFRRR